MGDFKIIRKFVTDKNIKKSKKRSKMEKFQFSKGESSTQMNYNLTNISEKLDGYLLNK